MNETMVDQGCRLDPFKTGEPSLPSGPSLGTLGQEGVDLLRGSTVLEEFSQWGNVRRSYEPMLNDEPEKG
jgi:hypothetical protein